jgi:small subunit ribosomal protein S20
VRRAARNRGVRSEVKTLVVKARKSLLGGPVAESERFALMLEAVRALDRAASKGVLHKNNASRRKGRLTKQMAKLAIASPAPVKGKQQIAKKGVAVAAKPAASAAKPAAAKAATPKKK